MKSKPHPRKCDINPKTLTVKLRIKQGQYISLCDDCFAKLRNENAILVKL